MSDTPKKRRRLTDDERIARLDSQRQMIERRAGEKRIDRVKEALGLIEEIPDLETARLQLRAWLTDQAVQS